MEESLRKVVAQLEALPPGSLVPRDWILGLVANGEAASPAPREPSAVDLTVEAVAELFGKRPSTVRSWIERGHFPGSYKLHGRQWRVPPAAIDTFQRTQQAARGGTDLSAWRRNTRTTP